MANRNLSEYMDIVCKLVRGVFYRPRFSPCGKLLRVGRGVRVLKKAGTIAIGDKVQLHRQVKLSCWGAEENAKLTIGSGTAATVRRFIAANRRKLVGTVIFRGTAALWTVIITSWAATRKLFVLSKSETVAGLAAAALSSKA